MDYHDERIIEMQLKGREQIDPNKLDVEDIIEAFKSNSFRMNQKELNLLQRPLFEESLMSYLPEDYVQSSLRELKVKYPSEQRPQIVYRNKRDTINIGFQLIEESVPDEHIVDMRNVMRDAYKQVNPVTNILEEGLIEVGGRPLAYYAFDSFALGGQMFNLVYVTRLNEQILIGVMNSGKKDMRMCKPLFQGIMHTLEFKDEEMVK